MHYKPKKLNDYLRNLRKQWLVTPRCSVVKCFWCSLSYSKMYRLLLQGC